MQTSDDISDITCSADLKAKARRAADLHTLKGSSPTPTGPKTCRPAGLQLSQALDCRGLLLSSETCTPCHLEGRPEALEAWMVTCRLTGMQTSDDISDITCRPEGQR